jgi:hypothetical protein
MSDVQLDTGQIQVGCVRDISERQTYTAALEYQALHDPLTDLPNRLLFADGVDHAIRAALRRGEPLALLVIDLDEFKQANDTIGHPQGDALLKLVHGNPGRVPGLCFRSRRQALRAAVRVRRGPQYAHQIGSAAMLDLPAWIGYDLSSRAGMALFTLGDISAGWIAGSVDRR